MKISLIVLLLHQGRGEGQYNQCLSRRGYQSQGYQYHSRGPQQDNTGRVELVLSYHGHGTRQQLIG